ncbi:MAG: hypothetical protein GX595_13365 [Lentisphaerae bacterium]|nr:hypothetical protein [Lentisphaerota bacterium]
MDASARDDDLSEFYRELALLARSELPLPESVEALAAGCADRGFRHALGLVAGELRRGVPLAEAMAGQERFFPAFHRALIRGGEHAGALPEALHEVAEVARRSRAMALDFREIMAYPLVTTWFAITVMLLMMHLYLPSFGQDIQALLEGPLPPFSAALFALASWHRAHGPLVLLIYLVVLGATLWLLSDLRPARRALGRLLRALPGTRRVVSCLDLSRVCGVAGVLMRRGTPLPDVLAAAAPMAEDPALAERLQACRRQCEQGRSLADSLDGDGLPATLILSLRHTREADLPDELEAMRDHYLHLAESTARRVGLLWQVGAILGMALAAGAVILAMFLPMIELYSRMVAD